MVTIIAPAKIMVGERSTFGCTTDLIMPYKYHWMKNGALLSGAPSEVSYTTPPLRKEDIGASYSVRVWAQNGTETSPEVKLSMEQKPQEKK